MPAKRSKKLPKRAGKKSGKYSMYFMFSHKKKIKVACKESQFRCTICGHPTKNNSNLCNRAESGMERVKRTG